MISFRSSLILLIGFPILTLSLLIWPVCFAADDGPSGTVPTSPSAKDASNGSDVKVVVTSTTVMSLRGSVGADLNGSFFVQITGGTVHTLTVQASDLIGNHGGRIPGTAITVEPAAFAVAPTLDDPATLHRFNITVSAADVAADEYAGVLYIEYAELADSALLTLPLNVAFVTMPDVHVAANSANQTLAVMTRWCDLPYFGRPVAATTNGSTWRFCGRDGNLGELPIFLEETAGAPATLRQAEVLSVRRADGLILPAGVVNVAQASAQTVPASLAAEVKVAVQGWDLPAGTYLSTLRISIQDITEPIYVAMNFNIKHNGVWAFLTLALSFSVFLIVGVYNRSLPQYRAMREVDQRRRALEGLFVDGERRVALRSALNTLADTVLTNAPTEDIERLQKSYDEQVAAAVAAAVATITAHLTPVVSRLSGLTQAFAGGSQQPQALLAGLAANANYIRSRAEARGYSAFEIAKADVEKLDAALDVLASIQANWGQMDPELRKIVVDAVSMPDLIARLRRRLLHRAEKLQRRVAGDTTHSLPETLTQAVADLPGRIKRADDAELVDLCNDLRTREQEFNQVVYSQVAGAPAPTTASTLSVLTSVSKASKRAAEATSEAEARMAAWRNLRFRWRIVTALAVLLAYLVALWVGWALFYYESPTFGVTPRDYLELFFWGAAVNFVAGQSINLNNLYTRQSDNNNPG